MGGFGFTEAQEMFRRNLRRFVEKEIAPQARERAKQDTLSREVVRKLGEFGLFALNMPEKYGGQSADFVTAGIAVEEVARGDFVLFLPVLVNIGAGLLISHGADELQQEWIPPLVRGEKLAGYLLTEPDCGSDAAAIKTRAYREGDVYILNGEKTSATMGMQVEVAPIFVKTDPSAGARGVSCLLLPMDLPGITKSVIPDMAWESVGRASIILDNVRLPARYILGDEGQGFYMSMQEFNYFRPCLGLAALAQAQVALEEAMEYAKQRFAFGKPIGKYEGVSFLIAEHATRVEAGRLLCYRTLWLRDQGLPHTKEAAMSKWFCPEISVSCIHDALLIHGHVGYSQEYPVEQRLRDVIGLEIGDGCAQIQKLIIVRELMGREFLPY